MKWIKYLIYLIFAISGVFTIVFFVGDSKAMTLPFLGWAGVLLVIAIALMLLMPLPQLLKNKTALKRTLFTLLGAVVLCVACYLIASPAMPSQSVLAAGVKVSPSTMKLTEAGLYLTYLLLVVSLLSLLGLSIYKSIKNR